MKLTPFEHELANWLAMNIHSKPSKHDGLTLVRDGTMLAHNMVMECRFKSWIEPYEITDLGHTRYRLTPLGKSLFGGNEPAAVPAQAGVTFAVERYDNAYLVTSFIDGKQRGYLVDSYPQSSTWTQDKSWATIFTETEAQEKLASLKAPATPSPVAAPDSGEAGDAEPEYYLDSDDGYWRLYKKGEALELAKFTTSERYAAEAATRLLQLETSALRSQLAAITGELAAARERVDDLERELAARGQILDSAVAAKQELFPNTLGNGWIDSITVIKNAVIELREQRAELREQRAELAHQNYKLTTAIQKAYDTALANGGIPEISGHSIVHDMMEILEPYTD